VLSRFPSLTGLALAAQALPATALAQAAPPAPRQPVEIHQAQIPVTQVPATPSEAARAFADAAIKHDNAAAASFVTDASREDVLALMDLSDQLLVARAKLERALAEKFPSQQHAVVRPAALDPVRRVEVAAERQITPTLVELDMRLFTQPGKPPTSATWRVAQMNGAWKIELPQCVSPQQAAPLRARLTTLLDAHAKTVASIHDGEFATATAARKALSEAVRRDLPAIAVPSPASPAAAPGRP
jgi:hypothetical protein